METRVKLISWVVVQNENLWGYFVEPLEMLEGESWRILSCIDILIWVLDLLNILAFVLYSLQYTIFSST